jgi:hypothetical protein
MMKNPSGGEQKNLAQVMDFCFSYACNYGSAYKSSHKWIVRRKGGGESEGEKGKKGRRNRRARLCDLRDACQESGGLKVGGAGVGREVERARARQGPRGKGGGTRRGACRKCWLDASGACPPPRLPCTHLVSL